MLLEHSLGMRSEAEAIAHAVESVVHDGYRTKDLGAAAKGMQARNASGWQYVELPPAALERTCLC